MLKSSKPVHRKVDDDKEDTDGPRGPRGYGRGETSEGKAKPMDGTGTKQGRKADAEQSAEGARNSEGAAKPGRYAW